MRTQVTAAVKRHCRSWAACALVSLGAIAAVCSLVISVEPVGRFAPTPALSSTPSAAAGWSSQLNSSSKSADDVGALAGACSTPIRIPKVCACSWRHMYRCMARQSAREGECSQMGTDAAVHTFAGASVGCRAHTAAAAVCMIRRPLLRPSGAHPSADARQHGDHGCCLHVPVVTNRCPSVAARLWSQAATVRADVQRAASPRLHVGQAEHGIWAKSLRFRLADSATLCLPGRWRCASWSATRRTTTPSGAPGWPPRRDCCRRPPSTAPAAPCHSTYTGALCCRRWAPLASPFGGIVGLQRQWICKCHLMAAGGQAMPCARSSACSLQWVCSCCGCKQSYRCGW